MNYSDDWNTPKNEDFFNSHFFLKIPQEIISNVFEGMPIGGQ